MTSGKGGVGKTTCCASIGKALAARGRKTILIEGDVGLNNLDVVLGVEDDVLYDVGEVAAGKISLSECVMKVDDNLFLLPASTPSTTLLTAGFFRETTLKLDEEFRYILIDSPAGLEEGFHRSVACAKEAILVTTPHVTSIRDAFKTSRVLEGYGMEKIGLIVNRVRGNLVLKKETLSPEEIAKTLSLPLCGVVPEDDETNLGLPVDPESKDGSGLSFSLIASYIEGESRRVFDCTAEYKGFRNRLRRWLA